MRGGVASAVGNIAEEKPSVFDEISGIGDYGSNPVMEIGHSVMDAHIDAIMARCEGRDKVSISVLTVMSRRSVCSQCDVPEIVAARH